MVRVCHGRIYCPSSVTVISLRNNELVDLLKSSFFLHVTVVLCARCCSLHCALCDCDIPGNTRLYFDL